MKDTEKIIKMLRSHRMGCFGCGYEHNCCDNGCALMQMAANELEKLTHHTEPENKPLTNFSHIIESPESLGKFLQAINNSYIHFDNIYCHAQCDDDDNCPHELQCIINWLNQPYVRKPEGSETHGASD